MERKKRSKGRGWESCYVKKIYGTFGVEMRAYGQKLVKFCTHTHTRVSYSSIDITLSMGGPDGGGGVVPDFLEKKALRRCNVQCYQCYEGVGGGPIYRTIALRNT